MKKSVLLNPFDQQIILFSVAGLIVSIFIFSAKKDLLGPKKTRKLLCCRGLLASLGYTCLIVSLKMISPANCSTVSNVGILLTAILSRFILKEKLSISHIIALVLTILGVTMISMQKRYPALVEIKIESNASIYSESIFNVELINLIGTLLALSSTSLFSGVNIILKLLSNNNIHWSISTIYSVYFGLPLAITCRLICIPFLDKNDYLKNGTDVFLINVLYAVAGSVFDTFGLIFLNIALKYEDPTKITIVRTSNVFFVFLFQYFMLHIKFEMFSIIGAISIGVGSLLVLIMNIIEKKASQSNDSDTRFKRILFYKF
jgi:drug/metabolite transporter (DMT)-like permease